MEERTTAMLEEPGGVRMARYPVGHTGITWPFTLDGAEQAIADIASLGYQGFETFGWTIEQFARERQGGIAPLLERHGLPLVSAYCSASLIDPSRADQDVSQIVTWARLVKDLGGKVIVLGANGRKQEHYSAEDYRGMVRMLDEVGRRVRDLGLIVAFHPHTGTPVETREEIDRVMGQVDPETVFFAPDTGQIQKGGADAVAVLRDYRQLIRHVHVKDYDGQGEVPGPDGKVTDRTGYLNYTPVGEGVVDFTGMLALLDEIGYHGWLMVELDGTPAATRTPKEAARVSKVNLERLLGK
jgi:inosose dehydratase